LPLIDWDVGNEVTSLAKLQLADKSRDVLSAKLRELCHLCPLRRAGGWGGGGWGAGGGGGGGGGVEGVTTPAVDGRGAAGGIGCSQQV